MHHKVLNLIKSIWVLTLLSGCASHPTVYVYGKYLTKQQTESLTETLESNAFLVEVNDFEFPTSISENTILYSLLLEDAETLSLAESLFTSLDIPINNVEGLTKGNHWYTKNSLALFVFPNEKSANSGVFKQDLANLYTLNLTESCNMKVSLALRPDGSYSFNIDNPSAEITQYLQGQWLYRQYPYLELLPENEPYSSAYFEISKTAEQDQISKIEFIELAVIESKVLPIGCTLQYGQRF